jgi:hypothetical protein
VRGLTLAELEIKKPLPDNPSQQWEKYRG